MARPEPSFRTPHSLLKGRTLDLQLFLDRSLLSLVCMEWRPKKVEVKAKAKYGCIYCAYVSPFESHSRSLPLNRDQTTALLYSI